MTLHSLLTVKRKYSRITSVLQERSIISNSDSATVSPVCKVFQLTLKGSVREITLLPYFPNKTMAIVLLTATLMSSSAIAAQCLIFKGVHETHICFSS